MALPVELLDSLEKAPGFDRPEFEKAHEEATQVTSLRLNPAKMVDPAIIGSIESQVPWSSYGYYLQTRPRFIFDPLIHAGAYYVQEASSMFLEQAVAQSVDLSAPLKVLDLCAAPGGKSTLLHSILSPGSLLVSNEVIRSRVTILEENLAKWGAMNVVATNNDPKDFQKLPAFFDLMIVDAPCSGSGLFRRDPEAVREWSLSNVNLCSQRQQRILADALPALSRDGVLIYCTCSYSVEEDELIGDWLIREHGMQPVKLTIEDDWNVIETKSDAGAIGYRFYPDKLKGEGFFLSCFRNTGGEDRGTQRAQRLERASKLEMEAAGAFISPDNLLIWKFGDRILSIPQQLEHSLGVLIPQLYIRKAGASIGKVAGKELIPDHELALTGRIKESVQRWEFDRETALQYLRRDEISGRVETRGWTLATYKGHPLGWMKVLPNRINNYYPKEWRILKSMDN